MGLLPRTLGLLLVAASVSLSATPVRAVPATPVMTVYRFNGPPGVAYYRVDEFARRGTSAQPAGYLAQGTSVVPCLVVRGGKPLTDAKGTPYVGFEIVVDARNATPDAVDVFRAVQAGRQNRAVRNHHCPKDTQHVVGIRDLYAMDKPPFFDPPQRGAGPTVRPTSELDAIVRAFHDSPQCRQAQKNLVGRREALAAAWSAFTRAHDGPWSRERLEQARHLDYVLRTTLYEGHLDRGCNAYGACERNVIALSIRNRARESCARAQGCRYRGDFEGVASKVSQYNIWDEFLTQVSGLTSCFLRSDLGNHPRYEKIRAMYAQNQPDVEKILFGDDDALSDVFRAPAIGTLRTLRHYYHPPAMGKCFPEHPRVEYISGAVARRGDDFALIANTRIEVGEKRPAGYAFRSVSIDEEADRDVVRTSDPFPGFLVDPRKVPLRRASRCPPYGTPAGCHFKRAGRYRRTPGWLSAGRPIEISCRVRAQGASCQNPTQETSARVGGVCDTAMQPIAGVP